MRWRTELGESGVAQSWCCHGSHNPRIGQVESPCWHPARIHHLAATALAKVGESDLAWTSVPSHPDDGDAVRDRIISEIAVQEGVGDRGVDPVLQVRPVAAVAEGPRVQRDHGVLVEQWAAGVAETDALGDLDEPVGEQVSCLVITVNVAIATDPSNP